jgi:hypothetical protein
MSLNISLIEYKSCEDGNLYEKDSEIIESAFLSPDIFEMIKDKYPLCETEVFEEEGSSESSTIENVSDDDIHGIKELLENEFVRLIEAKESQDLKSLITPNSVFEAIEKFRTLTNVYHIFWLKNENFSKRSNVLIKIG